MGKSTESLIKELKVIAIVRNFPPEELLNLASALLNGGIRLIEVTFNQNMPDTWKETANSIRKLTDRCPGSTAFGAGTVMTQAQLGLAIDAGAQFIVSPNANLSLIQETRAKGLVSIPGAFSPSEISAAYDSGANFVKVFPADILGAAYFKAIKAPLNHIPLLAVGGITADNAMEYMKAGAAGIGIGGSLVNAEWVRKGEFDKITLISSRLIDVMKVQGS